MFGSQGTQAFTMGFSGSPPSQADGSAKKARQEEKTTCLPITIRGIETAVAQRSDDGGDLRFFGTEPGMLILVACVEGLVKQQASLEMVLNDGTGRIKARHYMTDEQTDTLEGIAIGRYVNLFGAVRTAPELHFAAAGVRLVQSADEISYHTVEAMHAALKLQKGGSVATPSPKKLGTALGNAMDVTPAKGPEAQAFGSPQTTMAAVEEAKPAPSRQRLEGAALRAAALAFVRREGEGVEAGVAATAVCAHLEPAPAAEVVAVLEALVSDGEVFNTIDDTHFSCDI